MDIVDVDELLKDDSFCETEQLEDDIVEILKQWRVCSPFSSANPNNDQNNKGSKYIDTRTFTRPKKKFAENFSDGAQLMQSPSINLQIGGLVTPSSLQKSWLNDVSPPGSIMEISMNDRMGSSLITSGDFTNVSYLLNNNTDEIGPDSHFLGYGLTDVIKDRQFLEKLSIFDDNTLTKDCNISRTDLNCIEETFSGCTTMQNSIESIPKSNKLSFDDTEEQLNVDENVVNIVINSTFDSKSQFEDEILNSTFNAKPNLNGTFTKKPKAKLNDTFDALKVNFEGRGNTTFNALTAKQSDDLIMNTTFGVIDKCNDTFLLNKSAQVNGEEKHLNQTYDYHIVLANESPIALQNDTFDQIQNETFDPSPIKKLEEGETSDRFNHTFDDNSMNKTMDFSEHNGTNVVQSTPFHKQSIVITHRNSNLEFETNVSPISSIRAPPSRKFRQPTNEDSDVDLRRMSSSPKTSAEKSVPNMFETEKRVSLQNFEDFEKSISILEKQSNELEFDEMLNSFDVKKSKDSDKMRQELNNIKKRHSFINIEKQQEELRRKDMSDSHIDNRLIESINKSMSSSSGSERLLNRRSRINDDIHLTLSPQKNPEENGVEQPEIAPEPIEPIQNNPLPTEEVESSDRKNRDRFKTIRISKKREEGMVYVAPDIDTDDTNNLNVFSKIDYNSPKNSRLTLNNTTTSHVLETDSEVFKVPQQLVRPESKLRSLSKPRVYNNPPFNKKDLSLPLSMKSCSTDNLENNKPEQYSQQIQQRIPSKLSINSSNLKSPMGTKSKSYHNLVFNSNNSASNNNLNKIPSKLGTSASKLSHNVSNTELKSNASKIQSNLRMPRASSLVRPVVSTKSMPDAINNTNTNQTKLNSQLSATYLRAPNTKRTGLMRPSSGFHAFNGYNPNRKIDSDNESVNSLSSSSASSRGSLYRVDSQNITNNVQNDTANSIEDISVGNVANTNAIPRASGLRPPSNLRPPSARSSLPRPTSYVRR